MAAKVVTAAEAGGDIRRIDNWWREHRPAAPLLFFEELAGAFAVLGDSPEIGRRYALRAVPGLRRLVLRLTRYHVH